MVGFSPQTGQAGSRRTFISRNLCAKASYIRRRPNSGSPAPSNSLIVSTA